MQEHLINVNLFVLKKLKENTLLFLNHLHRYNDNKGKSFIETLNRMSWIYNSLGKVHSTTHLSTYLPVGIEFILMNVR